ncbi:acetyltransferase [Marinomonas mediterranea]|uniref:Sugar O-acyltransferase, sialic acid O-acetyltransferase NeuD family n=1 Tax=Marinomonas mediterranea (strain ATCC 700492 / JCM 21426 / NBRC 103028 / MMB-1) TaxID=717774 RepID=F2K4C0_MARM1|nr:acetyltransferase [Marinomonas mediterranea]ADZ92561.1 sugar O-acyltransferase, sialic acid O-acetyltransferase NeuD family [Marinomonas mediterranea MMB-1]
MLNDDNFPLILIGGGGHASVLADILISQGREIAAVVSPEISNVRRILADTLHIESDEQILKFDNQSVRLVNGIGLMPNSQNRKKAHQYFVSLGYRFETVVSDSALISTHGCIGKGAQVLSRAVVNTGSYIGENSIVNTSSVVEHDCSIGEGNHIATNATLCGHVVTGDDVFIGANATIIQGVTIGASSIIGAGVVVTRDVAPKSILYAPKSHISTLGNR